MAAACFASFLDLDDSGKNEDAALNPNLVDEEFFGGRGGGVPSSESGLLGLPEERTVATLLVYFCLMNRSIAESASSASMGTGGFRFSALYIWFEATLPTFRMFYLTGSALLGKGQEGWVG
jgi:hypothetical protein